MAQVITRKFEVYDLKAFVPKIDADGELTKEMLYDGEACEVSMTEAKARKIVCDHLNIGRVPTGTMLSYKKVGERTYSMPLHTFIKLANVVSDDMED